MKRSARHDSSPALVAPFDWLHPFDLAPPTIPSLSAAVYLYDLSSHIFPLTLLPVDQNNKSAVCTARLYHSGTTVLAATDR